LGLIVRASPGIALWPGSPRFSLSLADEPGDVLDGRSRVVSDDAPFVAIGHRRNVEGDPGNLAAERG